MQIYILLFNIRANHNQVIYIEKPHISIKELIEFPFIEDKILIKELYFT